MIAAVLVAEPFPWWLRAVLSACLTALALGIVAAVMGRGKGH
jgi:hypothetical protein